MNKVLYTYKLTYIINRLMGRSVEKSHSLAAKKANKNTEKQIQEITNKLVSSLKHN